MIGVRIMRMLQARRPDRARGGEHEPRLDTPARRRGAARKARTGRSVVRGTAGLEDRLLHATSAGNDAGPSSSATAAGRASCAPTSRRRGRAAACGAAAATRSSVENLVETPARRTFEPGCLGLDLEPRRHDRRGRHGRVLAPARHRWPATETGTSMASPQVAGLAMYLWSIAPDLTAPQLRGADGRDRRPAAAQRRGRDCGTDVPSAPRLDAYAAVLSLDQAAGAHAGERARAPGDPGPRRRRGRSTRPTSRRSRAAPAPTPGTRDWSRSDLNGDGFTGGRRRPTPFDLELIGSHARRGAARSTTVEPERSRASPCEFDERTR